MLSIKIKNYFHEIVPFNFGQLQNFSFSKYPCNILTVRKKLFLCSSKVLKALEKVNAKLQQHYIFCPIRSSGFLYCLTPANEKACLTLRQPMRKPACRLTVRRRPWWRPRTTRCWSWAASWWPFSSPPSSSPLSSAGAQSKLASYWTAAWVFGKTALPIGSYHRLNIELVYLGSSIQLYSLAETRNTPPPPCIWAHVRGRYWSAKIDYISL